MVRFFDREVEYGGADALEEGFRPGTLYTYVGYSLLDGVAAQLEPVRAWGLNHYGEWDAARVLATEERWANSWGGRGPLDRVPIGSLGDDVVVLMRNPRDERLWMLWYDCDVSDCSVGRGYRTATEELAEKEVRGFGHEVFPLACPSNWEVHW